MKKINKIKAVVFVVAALFLATAVTVNAGVPDDYPIDGYPIDNGDGEGDEEYGLMRDEILSIFDSYSDDLLEIEEYILEYINEHESYDEIFTMPTELQATIDTVLDEISAYVGDEPELMQEVQELLMEQGNQPGGGITDINGPHWFAFWFPALRMGYYWNVWLSDDAVDAINSGSILLFCLLAFGPYAMVAAIIITTHLILITNANQGDGVYFKILLYLFPAPWLLMVDLQPQYSFAVASNE